MNLTLQFQSLHEFLWMNGHGPYVWSSYAITFFAMAMLVWIPCMQRTRFLKQQKSLAVRQHQHQESSKGEV